MATASIPGTATATVTLLFTDIEGSTRLLQTLGRRYADLLARHNHLLRSAIEANSGRLVDTAGDGLFAVFDSAHDAVSAAVAAQRALAAERWPDGVAPRVRMGVHTGEPIPVGDGWIGLDVHRAARISEAAAGGQILLSGATCALVGRNLPAGTRLRELGSHLLRDLHEPEHLFQLDIDGHRTDFPPIGSRTGGLFHFPAAPTPLIGREVERAAIARLLQRDDVRIVTLTGPGGTGKTRLALEVGRELAPAYEHGAWFVALAPLRDPELVGPTLARALELSENPSLPVLDHVALFLAQRHSLLVLDNFEHVTEAATFVAALLHRCPRLDMLVTSRGPLRIRSEHEYPVPPLATPDQVSGKDLEALAAYPAISLFVERARAARPGFELTVDNAVVIAEICTALEGLPLALELAAARLRLFSPQALLARLGRRLDLLQGGARDLPERHQALRRTIAWSYDLLEEPEQRLFRELAAFNGGCTLDAAEQLHRAVGGEEDVLALVASLIDRGLVRREEDERGETRLVMFETIREFGLEQLEQMNEAATVHAAHAALFLEFAERAAAALTGPDTRLWLGHLDAEHDNIRVAFDWAVAGGHTQVALRLGAAVWRFCVIHGHMNEGRNLLQRASAMPDARNHPAELARALYGLGTLTHEISDFLDARAPLEQALEIRRELGDRAGEAEALNALSWVAGMIGDLAIGEQFAQEAGRIHTELGDRRGHALALNNLGFIRLFRGEPRAAVREFEAGLRLRRDLRDARGIAFTQINLSLAHIALGDTEPVPALLDDSLATLTALRDTQLIAWNLNAQGSLAFALERPAPARTLLEECLRLWREVGNKFGAATSLSLLARVEALEERLDRLDALLAEAAGFWKQTGSRIGHWVACVAAAEARIVAGRIAHAARDGAEAVDGFRQLGDLVRLTDALIVAARIAAAAGEWTTSAGLLRAARLTRERTGAKSVPRQDRVERQVVDAIRQASGAEPDAGKDASLDSLLDGGLQLLVRLGRETAPA